MTGKCLGSFGLSKNCCGVKIPNDVFVFSISCRPSLVMIFSHLYYFVLKTYGQKCRKEDGEERKKGKFSNVKDPTLSY
jgi:hypothetical protein